VPGFIYALHASNGETLPNFPITMSEIQVRNPLRAARQNAHASGATCGCVRVPQAQVAVEDVNGDGMLELVAIDKLGNVLCFDRNGNEVRLLA
jgi:hypothetical protein